MGDTLSDRRGETRLTGVSLPVSVATIRPGTPAHIVNLSETGVLVQCARALRPGARVHLRIDTARGAIGLGALVLRCAVWAIHPSGGVSYRAAIRFESRCPAFWKELVLERRIALPRAE
jgi:hypothetical protein